MLEEVVNILEKHFPGEKASLLFASVAGSRSFNLNMPDSDADLFGVYVLNCDEVIKSIPINSKFKILSSHEPDYTLYEVHTFCELLLKGNPKVIEPLFQTHLCYWDKNLPYWQELINNRNKFINSTVISQYLGFATSQLQDSSKGKGKTTKKYYHALRLLKEAKRMINFKNPLVWMEGKEREYLMSIRRNEIDINILDKEIEEDIKYIKEHLSNNDFLKKINENKEEYQLKEFLDKWLINLRRYTLNNNIKSKDNDNNNNNNNKHPLYIKTLNILTENNIKGDIICCCLSGKYLHCKDFINDKKTQLNDIKKDYIAIYITKTNNTIGLQLPIQRISEEKTSIKEIRDTYTQGIIIHEISNICSLIQQGNHRIMEILFSDNENDYTTNEWNNFKTNRKHFITQIVTNHYLGVGRGQLVSCINSNKQKGLLKKQKQHIQINYFDIEDNNVNRKKLYHALRLLYNGCIIVKEKTIPIQLQGDYGELIYGILTGKTSIQQAVNLGNYFIKQVEELKLQLKEVPRRIEQRYSSILEDWIFSLRKNR